MVGVDDVVILVEYYQLKISYKLAVFSWHLTVHGVKQVIYLMHSAGYFHRIGVSGMI